MMKTHKYRQLHRNSLRYSAIILALLILGYSTATAQQDLAQQAYLIFQQSCLGCHGEQGAFREDLLIEHTALIDTKVIVPGNPDASEFYRRLIEDAPEKPRMPSGQPPLTQAALTTIRKWIAAGAPNWEIQNNINFITTDAMLTAIENHLEGLDSFNRPFARYFTTTHLHNAGESTEALRAYRVALSKLVNSLSWGLEIINPQPIDAAETVFYIDLRNYDWDTRNAWSQIEGVYPYAIAFAPETQARLLEQLTNLRQEMNCEVPFVYVDWFLATASLPPLYHDLLALPETERELERELGIDVARNLQSAPGIRVWRAGTNNSGVSNNNRVVERHTSRYGAYWKSHDFASNTGRQHIFTHPLSFKRDGGEVIFNLPNGLQAYYISDALGNRIDVAPTDIVSNPAASDPAVRNGISCIGCHTEGMKTFEDEVRAGIQRTVNPSYDKAHALRLYVEKVMMDELLWNDTQRFREALEATGGVFGGIEPIHRFYEVFRGPLDAAHAAASLGLETEVLLAEIRERPSLQRLGLTGLLGQGGIKRDIWTSNFSEIVSALNTEEEDTIIPLTPLTPDDYRPEDLVYIPDANLREVIASALGKTSGAAITTKEVSTLKHLVGNQKDIEDLTGLEAATRLERIEFRHNAISDLSPLTGLARLVDVRLQDNAIEDVSPLAGLTGLGWLALDENAIKDLSPVKKLIKLNRIRISDNPISDVSPLAGLISLERIDAWRTLITDFSPLAKLPRLTHVEFGGTRAVSDLPSLKGLKALGKLVINNSGISNISGLAELTQLTSLTLRDNAISDVSPLANLKGLTYLELGRNRIADVSPLTELKMLEELSLDNNEISDVSPLVGLSKLDQLDLRNNSISDFSALEGLLQTTFIKVDGNPGTFVKGQKKIEGPWLWIIAPTGGRSGAQAAASGIDFLTEMSDGTVTELEVAANGASAENPIGDSFWIIHKLSPTGQNNINDMVNATGLGSGNINHHVAYGFVPLDSPRAQKTKMFVGSDDAVKVWLNGELVHNNPVNRRADGFQDQVPVTLKEGKNVLFVAIYNGRGGWSGFFGFAPDAEYKVLSPGPRFSLSTNTTQIEKGDTFTIRITAENITDLAGWEADIIFDAALLKANNVNEGDFLKQGSGQTFFQKGTIKNKEGKITGVRSARTSIGGGSGHGTLLLMRFTAVATGEGRVFLRNFRAGSSTGKEILSTSPETRIVVAHLAPTFPAWDVNADGVTNAMDVNLVTNALGQKPPKNPRTDVNRDGVVNGEDLALVAAHLGERVAPAAPANLAWSQGFTPEIIERALDILYAADDGSPTFRRGIENLERFFGMFIPKKTVLLCNYPNPFNPETWIPYQLSEPAEVTLHIYAATGTLVRTLALGHKPAGIYQYRSRAAYWDGRNDVGESVASGLYFYTLTVGDFTATRKMLIQK